ncbi:UDP-N-acetylmuramoyl-L-alanine--D-glutamate ligase [Epidermidibacterium keratini]|uniref:UDP-N-acetylmuramoylalanine--D-glutamate ligase n=1 Tax=Epidermidibacterium keratini TaxID=1891644 RepID=A0A7L4YSR9_9ACTN|nr:UDP-N-acetylmuramoyl-L-alanine--D-glutamate ligase [Epidermidibacterium keratini]
MDPAALRGAHVLVAGGGRSGTAVARALARQGALVQLADQRPDAVSSELRELGVQYAGDLREMPQGISLVVTSPGWAPTVPLLADALERGIRVVGEVELAWALRDHSVPWLAITGTNGKTTAVGMLTAILRAGGFSAAEVGNVGPPVIDAVTGDDAAYEIFAVELSSFQLHWAPSVAPAAGALLNIAADHLDWHGSLDAYAADKARIWGRGESLAVCNADDAHVMSLAAQYADADRLLPFTLAEPQPGQLGVAGGWLLDRTRFARDGAERIIETAEVRPTGPHNVANALAAAALARTVGLSAEQIAQGLRDYAPGAHRNVLVVTETAPDGRRIGYVNDSKATNAHATAASLSSYDDVVWIAGGLLKGAVAGDFGGLIEQAAPRLRGVVLIGRDRAVLAEAMRRHAPNVPVIDVPVADHRGMDEAVDAARQLALTAPTSGSVTVLMAPAAASMDMFDDYAQRGDVFARAARRVAEGGS